MKKSSEEVQLLCTILYKTGWMRVTDLAKESGIAQARVYHHTRSMFKKTELLRRRTVRTDVGFHYEYNITALTERILEENNVVEY